MIQQLDFFENEKLEFFILKIKIENIEQSCQKVRKSLFARHGELEKLLIELNQRLAILEQHIWNK